MRTPRRDGYTLIELSVSVFIIALVSAGLARSFRWQPSTMLVKMVNQADFQRQLTQLTRTMSDDLRGADPLSVDWSVLPSTSALTFRVARFDFATASSGASPQIEYRFRPSGNGAIGTLVRIADSQESVLMTGVDAPSVGNPLFNKDLFLPQIVIISVSCRSKGLAEPWTRRIAIKS